MLLHTQPAARPHRFSLAPLRARWKRRIAAGLLSAWVGLSPAVAQSLGADVAGGSDHPLISRFAGSQLIGYKQDSFDQGRFYLPGKDPKKELDQNKPVTAEGQLTRLIYIAPPGRSPLEVQANFAQALRQAGLQVLTAVDGRQAWWGPSDLARLSGFNGLKLAPPWSTDISPMARDDGHYLYGTLQRGGVTVSVSVLTGPASLMARDRYKVKAETPLSVVAMQIVEPAAMATGAVTVNAQALGTGLAADGRIALYGIFFDTGRADLKPESQAQLAQMAELLKAQPTLRVHIVGHTDNVGAFEANQALSQQRAQAVAQALTAEYKIDAKRLSARGVASLSPLASNSAEAGRARNRRVELVAQ